MDAFPEKTLFPKFRYTLGWIALFILLAADIFNYPLFPSTGLDASWRIALGYFFQEGAQFGRDVVFTYGPLGFAMGKTYSGLQFGAIIGMQLVIALIGAWVIVQECKRLQGISRWVFCLSMMLFSLTYEDAAHMVIIVLMGFQLLRGDNPKWGSALLLIFLALFASIKFTDLMLATLVIAVICGHAAWMRRWRHALFTGGIYLAAFLAIWVACGQSVLNLPDYFRGSWSISQGYSAVMGFPAPWPPLWKAFVVLGIIACYMLIHLWTNKDKPRAFSNILLLAGFIFMNWKHGFVRADGHMIGFFFCAFVPLTTYPSLLEDAKRFRRTHYAMFAIGILMCLWGIESALYGVTRTSAGIAQERIWSNIESSLTPAKTKARYDAQLGQVRLSSDLSETKKLLDGASVDVLGFEQAAAIFNGLNYQPRPVIQSYSVFNSYLAKLNGDFYSSDQAPDYVLLKIQSIDYRMPMMDDPQVWRILPHRYDFVHYERGYQLWRKLDGPFSPSSIAPTKLESTSIEIEQTLSLEKYAHKQLWVRIDLDQTWLGRLHAFLYKPPHVNLVVTDEKGKESEFYMPLPQGKAGFILSPIIEDLIGYASFANGREIREARSLRLKIKPQDRFLFDSTAKVELSELTPAGTGGGYFNQINEQRFKMFTSFPIEFESFVPDSEGTVGEHTVIVMHAPSLMTFSIPNEAKSVSGYFGYIPGAYSDGGNTDGAEFVVYWSDGTNRVDLFKRFIDPSNKQLDRGAHKFTGSLSGLEGGKVYLQINPGPNGNYSWDWTWWSGVEIK